MRTITDHKLNGLNDALAVIATDAPGPGGANHNYQITGWKVDPSGVLANPDLVGITRIYFQNGPIAEAGINGVSNEALLAILIDRMRGFQHKRKEDGTFDFNSRGEYACRENAVALTQLEDALMWLQKRTRDRLARGVEGTSKV